jgi:hypothetical protein
MLNDAIANLLDRYLGKYFQGLDSLKVSVLLGKGELGPLFFKQSFIAELDLPFIVHSASIDRVHFRIPWSNLANEPSVIHVSNVGVVIIPRDPDDNVCCTCSMHRCTSSLTTPHVCV